MDWKSLAQRAVRAGVRQGIGYMRSSGRDSSALRAVDSLLRDDTTAPADSARSRGRRSADGPPRGAEGRSAGGARRGATGADRR
ncbi:MAG TPA: hypothetical protein VK065_00220, partial [Brevibacterium sp.]|nr:hypothetical protein [Brevibacterium sp.]